MSRLLVDLEGAIAGRLAELDAHGVVRRIWQRDATVWTDDPSIPELADRLGWLTVADELQPAVSAITDLRDEVRGAVERVILLGMGGSSLAPQVLWRAFGSRAGYPTLQVLDTTHPAAVQATLGESDPARTLFVVSSKSGTTLETMSLFDLCWDRTRGRGEQFVAITDRGTPLFALAHERSFRRVFPGAPEVGGRCSALSHFGLVPAALVGIDIAALLRRARAMAAACGATFPAAQHPAAALGVFLAEAALAGRDKVGLALSPGVGAFGLWVEQLLAESTGKEGTGILPVVEPPMDPGAAGDDRVFVSLGLATERQAGEEARLDALAHQSHPVRRLTLDGPAALGAEFFRWVFATAVAGAVLRINPFDQPNVEESKQNTRRILEGARAALPAPAQRQAVHAFLEGVESGHYVAVLAYLPPSAATDQRLAAFQRLLRDRLGVAVTAGYGPQYLHSTGQYHKGGPPTGHVLLIADEPRDDLRIPGRPYTFAQLIVAQALGDYRALTDRGRPVLRLLSLDALADALR